MDETKKRRWVPIVLLALALLAFAVASIERDPAPAPPPAPIELEPMALVAPTPEPVNEPEPQPEPAPVAKVARRSKPKAEPVAVEAPLPVNEPEPEPEPEAKPAEDPIPAPLPPRAPVLGGVEVLYQEDLPWLTSISVEVLIDHRVVGTRKLSQTEAAQPIAIFSGKVPVGRLDLEMRIKMHGDGGGVFSYIDEYIFTAKQHAVLQVEEGGSVRLIVHAVERDLTNRWEDRVGLRVEVQNQGLAKRG